MKKLLCGLLSLMLLLLPLSACGQEEDKNTLVRVNEVTHSIFYAPFYLAIECGFFNEEGIDVELTNGVGSNVSMTAVLSGQADVGLVGPETCVYVFSEGKSDYPIVFSQLTKRDGSFLISRTDEKNFSYENLKGKEIIAGRKGGMPAMTLEYVLNNHGLRNGENVTLNYDVAFNMMAGAFEGGTGDYTTLFEPTASDFENNDKGFVVASIGADSGEVPYTCFVASQSYIDDNRDTLKRFTRAVYKAIKFIREKDAKEVAKYLVKQFSVTTEQQVEATVESYLAIDAWMTNMAMTEDSFIRLQDIMQNAGELPRRAEYTKLIYNDIANEAYKEIFK